MVQNHMMQVLCLIAMEAPLTFDGETIRNEKVKVLRAIQPLTPEEVATDVVAGQYVAGTVHGKSVRGYRQEDGVLPNSVTETFVALKIFIENWRWGGVPFYLRTGKHLPVRATEVAIQFKRTPHMLYKPNETVGLLPNQLIIRIQPDEGISLKIAAKIPGAAQQLRTINMSFGYNESFGIELPEAYERLIVDCILGDSSLFIREDEIAASWSIIDSITRVWERQKPQVPLYPAGSWGPPEAQQLIERDGRSWIEPLSDL